MSEVARERAFALVEEVSSAAARPIRPDQRLGDLGVDSLAFAELAAALERDVGVDLSTAGITEDHRVEDVLRAVECRRGRATPAGLPPGIGRVQGPAKVVGGPALRWWFRLTVIGEERVPVSGPAVLAMNHESALDIPIAVVACPRPVTFMAKKELYKNAVVSWALRSLGGFQVDRDRFDLRAVDAAVAAIGHGDVLGMYPEGTRSPRTLLPFLPGAAWIAARCGVPLVPCSIVGTERAGDAARPGRVRVRVTFHEPIPVDRVDDLRERRDRAVDLTDRLRGAIRAGLAV